MELGYYYDDKLDIIRSLSVTDLLDLCDVEIFEDEEDDDEYYD